MRAVIIALACAAAAVPAMAQQQAAVLHVEVRAEGAPVAGAEVAAADVRQVTAADGAARLVVPPGEVEVTVSAAGFPPAAAKATLAPGAEQRLVVELQRHEEEVIVTATRTGARLDDQPTRVEVLGREEIEEKMLMTPGDIVMMLNEMGGMRVQTTSPSLGAASVRIQGMRGRYTRFLSDGLPLYGQQVGGLGLLQIPPMDLAQVEVIKGTASSLYGAGAMGGVVNLVSRRPGAEMTRELLINQSTRGATDVVAFLAAPLRRGWGATLLGGGHLQLEQDTDDDGWADIAGYRRAVLRPRFFWDGGDGRTLFLTGGVTLERREGGTLPGHVLPPTGGPYVESLDTAHFDLGGVGQLLAAGEYLLGFRFAAARRKHDHRFGEVRERDTHDSLFTEFTARRAFRRHTLVAGVAFERDAYQPRDFPQFRFEHLVPGFFLQDDIQLAEWLSASVSARVDHHNVYGAFFSPRVSVLLRKGGWSSRLSAGQGFFAPTPLTEETEAAGLSRLKVPRPLRAEQGRSASLDISRVLGPGTYTLTVFGSRIRDPLDVDRATYELVNLPRATTNAGFELLATFRPGPLALTASYTFVRALETEGAARVEVPLTPRHSAGVVAMWEEEGRWRAGLELYYTGAQRLEANPYRDTSRHYLIVGALVERRFGPVRAFLNAENVGGVRQTRWDPLLRPTRAPDGRWTVDAWAPLDGRTFNGGIRWEF